jgi:hypothetical protein
MPRTVVWFSCGAASTCAALLTLRETPDAELVYCNTGSEHIDNWRFLVEVEEWLGKLVTVIQSEKYEDTWQVFKERRYLAGPRGALCTTELKKIPRFKYQRPDDIQVFGYTAGEEKRAARFREQNFDVDFRAPLIDVGMTKNECLGTIRKAGIELPKMYQLGYMNNNCIGCVKGGAGYWNKIRRDFPEVFQRMALQERELNASIIRRKGERVFLDELPLDMGNYSKEPEPSCGVLCEAALEEDICES